MFKRIYLWEILVPTLINSNPAGLKRHKKWDDFVKQYATGMTIMRTSKGTWTNEEGAEIKDTMIPVRFTATKRQMRDIAEYTKEYYQQDAVMYYVISSKVYFL